MATSPSQPPPPWWHPDALAARQGNLAARQAVLRAIRRWFEGADFAEVDTPGLQVSPGLEPHLRAFATVLEGPQPGEARQLYLHTSPEFTMKKLLAGGVGRLFQMAHVWRNGERSATHHPEFTMLEWYRSGASYRDLIADCRELLQAACRAAGTDRLRRGGQIADPFADWEIISVSAAFARDAGIDLPALLGDDPAPLAREAARIGVRTAASDSWEDIFFRILLDRIEPHLGQGRPTVLIDYPLAQAALARPCPADPRFAERFELYACGLELANAFGELTDAGLQRARFETDMDLKQRLYGERYPIDEDFLAALAHPMPDAAGIALGFDRLVMLVTGAERIEDVLWAPVAPTT